MNKYYYLVASLPYLRFGERPPFTRKEFLSECRKWLSIRDMARILSLAKEDYRVNKHDTESIIEWKKADLNLKKEIAAGRGKKRRKNLPEISQKVKEIFELKTPLQREQAIEKIRWDIIEGMKTKHHFDVHSIAFYFLKLQIAARISGFDKEEGEAFFYRLCEVKYEQAKG